MPRSVLLGRPWPQSGEPLFTASDTNWALALARLRAEEAASRCPSCGLPKSVCRDPANQFAFRAEVERCHATYALAVAQESYQARYGKSADENPMARAALRANQWSAWTPPPKTDDET